MRHPAAMMVVAFHMLESGMKRAIRRSAMTTTYSAPEMSCGHCVAAIEKAVRSLDGAATVR